MEDSLYLCMCMYVYGMHVYGVCVYLSNKTFKKGQEHDAYFSSGKGFLSASNIIKYHLAVWSHLLHWHLHYAGSFYLL